MKKLSTYLCGRSMVNLLTWVAMSLFLAVSSDVLAQSGTATCNTVVALTNPTFSNLTVTSSQVPVFGGDEFSNKANLIDNDPTFNTAATFGFVAGSGYLEVKDNNATGANVYPIGSFAGFIINSTSLLSSITITTYLGSSTTAIDTKVYSNLADLGLLGGKTKVGLIATNGAFDRVRIQISGVASTLSVYAPLIERFCDTAPALACNTLTTLTAPTAPVYVNPNNTGFGGLLNIGSITNADNSVSADANDYASISITAGLGSTATFSIKNAINKYPGGSFAGMDISSPALLDISAVSSVTVSTYNSGTLVQSVAGANLVSANTSLLSGTGRRIIGFLTATGTTNQFDEVRLRIGKLVAAGVEETRIYGAVVEKFCTGPSTDCAVTDPNLPKNTLTPLVNPNFPVYVDGGNSGVNTVVCAGCSLNNTQNAVDNDPSSAATIVLTGGVAVSGDFAVANALDTYPINTYAGFDIESNTLLSANVLSTATIRLLNNGSVVQTSTGTGLIVGATSSLLGTGTSRQTIGVVATVPFDEVKISFSQLVNADLGTIKIYNAVIQKNCSTPIVCNTTYSLNTPQFPVVLSPTNTGVTGIAGVSTTIQDASNVISASTTDFARITNTASVAANARISVLDAVNTFPVGTFAGFTVKKVSGILAADLFSRLTVTTYLDGVQKETRSGGSLLDLSIALFGSTTNFYNVGFVTTQAFDEIQLSVAPLVGLDALGGSLDVYGAYIDTRTTTGGGLSCALNTNPDFAVTNKNVPATGSVKTNDIVPAGTTYGPAPSPASQPGGSSPSLTVNTDGTYTFSSATPGVYVYNVPVCGAGLSGTACATQTLTVTVLDPTVTTNKPVANPDIASTTGAASNPAAITINVKANDGPGNAGGTLGTPTITSGPTNGTASIVGGNLVYTPAAGFYGTDVVTYQVCETPGNLCATATVTITVNAPGSANTTLAADDYISTYQGVAATGNVKTNDSDPEGNTQTVTAQNTTVPGKGTFVLATDGTYTFTPVAGATGPVDFSYTTTDNGSPTASAGGTLHVLINPFNPNPDFAVTNKNVPATGSVKTNDVVPVGTTYGPAPAPASQPGGSSPSLTVNADGTYTFSSATPGVYVYNVPVCAPGQSGASCATQTLTVTVLDPTVTTNPPVANPDFATTTGAPSSPTAVTINVRANDGVGNQGGTLGTPTIPAQPAHGTASIVGGNLVYTPTAGYYGTDVVTYQVCETPSTLCASTTVTVTILAPGSPATVSINDDYIATPSSTSATGNVLTNDLGTGLTVSNPGTTVTSSGTLVVTSSGSYTFTPASGVTGPVTYTYTACDNASNCGSATLHILVGQTLPDLSPIIRLPLGNFTASGENASRDFIVEVTEYAGQATSSGNVTITITAPLGYNLTYSNAITSINVSGGTTNPVTVDNTKWTASPTSARQLTVTINSGQFISANGKATLGFTISRAGASTGTANLTVNVNDDASKTYDSNPLNNIYVRNVNAL